MDYISVESPERALKMVKNVRRKVKELARFPFSGRAGRVPNSRELVVVETPYIAAYTVEQDIVFVLAIFHDSQKWPEDFEG